MLFIYIALAIILFALASHGLMVSRHLLRKILALNILSSSVFLVLVCLAQAADPLDPVPHAMVLTGIVVAVSTTAVALALLLQLYGKGSQTSSRKSK